MYVFVFEVEVGEGEVFVFECCLVELDVGVVFFVEDF